MYLLTFVDAPNLVFPITQKTLDELESRFPARSFDAFPVLAGSEPVSPTREEGLESNLTPPVLGASPFDRYRKQHEQPLTDRESSLAQRLAKHMQGV